MIAPALIPRKPGERVKTNARDARKLAELLRAGLLTEVRPPTPPRTKRSAISRRARDDAREDLQRCRHRLGKLLLRRGLHYSGPQLDAGAPAVDRRAWRGRTPAERAVVDDYLLAIDQLEARLARAGCPAGGDRRRREPYREPVGWLRCFRGIDTLTAMLILAELHDFRRFASAPRVDGVSGAGARRGLQRREASAWPHHAHRECAGPPAAGGNGLALSTSAERRRGPDAATHRGNRGG